MVRQILGKIKDMVYNRSTKEDTSAHDLGNKSLGDYVNSANKKFDEIELTHYRAMNAYDSSAGKDTESKEIMLETKPIVDAGNAIREVYGIGNNFEKYYCQGN